MRQNPASTTASAARCCKPGSFLSGTQGDAEAVRAAWRQNTRLLLGKSVEEQRPDTFEQLSRAAKAIGVTIAAADRSPRRARKTQLVEAAAHECRGEPTAPCGGTRLEIFGETASTQEGSLSERWRCTCLLPVLSSTRTEAAGGAMEIAVLRALSTDADFAARKGRRWNEIQGDDRRGSDHAPRAVLNCGCRPPSGSSWRFRLTTPRWRTFTVCASRWISS